MPAMLEDPTSPPIYLWAGEGNGPAVRNEPLPESIQARTVQLRDRATMATLVPIGSVDLVPHRLRIFLCDLLNNEIEQGDTYPMVNKMTVESFGPYWFSNFAAVMFLGNILAASELATMEESGVEWKSVCLGSFYIKPNYPGRSSHVCNGGFLVSNASRNKGVGKLMGEGYLDWAPKLGYSYSVFNLVYETNHASIRIWDSLGFKRIGKVKGCGQLKSSPDNLVDAIMFGRELGPESEDMVSEERFDKIRYYLKHQKYPAGADRAEKSRLRSAATHYHLYKGPNGVVDEERLMLKDKEVIADQSKQYEIARHMHSNTHGGINKTTATIAEKYHWVRIKETVSLVIKNCPECRDNAKNGNNYAAKEPASNGAPRSKTPPDMVPATVAAMDAANSPPRAMAQMPPQQQHMTSFEQPMQPALAGTSSMPQQSPTHHQPPVSGPGSIHMSQTSVMPRQLQQTLHQHPGLSHQMQAHMRQNIIPPHINNHLGGMSMASAHATPAGSTVHTPLPSGPASAPISNMEQPFEMHQLDPQLQLQQFAHHDMTAGQLDDAIQNMGPLDLGMMHDLSDPNPMGMGEQHMHGMSDHSQMAHNGQQGHLGMGPMVSPHSGQPDGMIRHHDQHGNPVKSEMPDFGAESLLLEDMMDSSRNPNMG